MEVIYVFSAIASVFIGGLAGNQRTLGFSGGLLLGLFPIVGHISILAWPYKEKTESKP